MWILRQYSWLIFPLFLFQVSGGALQFTSNYGGQEVIGTLGSSLNFTWTFTGDMKSASWGTKTSVGDAIDTRLVSLTTSGPGSAVPPSQYAGRVSGTWDGKTSPGRVTFTLNSIRVGDNGSYACEINPVGLVGSSIIDTFQLVVTVPPVLSVSSVAASYNEGSQVSISCSATGKPDPDVKWVTGNRQLKSSGKKSAALTFNSISRTDDGQYICKANNSAGSTEKNVTLVVHYKPEGTTLTTSVDGDTAVQGDLVTITCKVAGAKPAVSGYRIYFNDSNTPLTEPTDGLYTINNVQRSQHLGKYKCVPYNVAGNGPQATVELNITVPPQLVTVPQNKTVNESNPVLLRCEASGYPAPTITWTKDGLEFQEAQRSVDISKSNRNDTGRYVCTADNKVGREKTAEAYVTVQYSATVTSYSPITTKSWIGQTVKLKCVSDGVPTPTVTWFKPDGNKLSAVIATENTVDVRMVVDGDFGDYNCVTDNGVKPADTATVKVLQITKPGAPNITSSEEDIQATSLTVKWSKPADNGGSPITAYRVVLVKNGAEIKNENVTDPGQTSLSVGGLDKNTEYDVSVFARNFMFEGTAGNKKVRTKFEGKPAAAELIGVPKEVKGDEVTLSWSEPPNNGAHITQYTVYQRTVNEDGTTGDWTQLKNITDVSAREYVVKVDTGKEYEFLVTATNSFGEGLKEEGKIQRVKVVGGSGSQAGGHGGSGGMDIGIIAGAAAGGVLLIITLILLIVLWRRRKESHREETSKDVLSAERGGDFDEGYASVSRAAAQSLAAAGNSGAVNYAVVDPSTRKKNRHPVTDQYAVVDSSKKNKKKRKDPNQLDYAELADFRPENQASVVVPAGAQAAAAATFRAPVYEGTEYADIAQFGVPQAEDATYANVPKKDDVVYSNVESM